MAKRNRDYLRSPFFYLKIVVSVITNMERPFRVLWAYFFLNRPEYTYTFRNKLIISTKFAEDVQTILGIFFNGTYGNVGSGKTIIDIGSNIGVFTLYAAYDKDNTVLAFEPSPVNFEILEENIKNNTTRGEITIVNKAIGSKRGTSLMASSLGVYSRLYRENERPKSDEMIDRVACITLEDLFHEYSIETCDLLKVDCEGFEYDILFYAPDYLFDRIFEIRMECHYVDDERNKKTMQEFLRSKGYYYTYDKGSIFFAEHKKT